MSPQALRYYLPAFLISPVLHYREANPIPDTILFLLRPPDKEDSAGRARFDARFGALGKPQRDAVAAFLEFLRDEYGNNFPAGIGNEPSVLLQWWASDSQK